MSASALRDLVDVRQEDQEVDRRLVQCFGLHTARRLQLVPGPQLLHVRTDQQAPGELRALFAANLGSGEGLARRQHARNV